MSNRSGQRAPVVPPGADPTSMPGVVPPPPDVLAGPPEEQRQPQTGEQAEGETEQYFPSAGIDMTDPEALMREARRLMGANLTDDPTADLSMPQQVVFPGNPRDVMRQAETIARQHDPFREHAQVAMGESIIAVHGAVEPLIAAGSAPDHKRSLNDMAEVSTIARQLHAQPKYTIMLPNGAENKQYDHPFGINGYIIYVLTGVPSIVPESIYLNAISAGLILPQRRKDYALCPRVSDLVKAAQIVQPHLGGIKGAGLAHD